MFRFVYRNESLILHADFMLLIKPTKSPLKDILGFTRQLSSCVIAIYIHKLQCQTLWILNSHNHLVHINQLILIYNLGTIIKARFTSIVQSFGRIMFRRHQAVGQIADKIEYLMWIFSKRKAAV